jgi:hypothetical protein
MTKANPVLRFFIGAGALLAVSMPAAAELLVDGAAGVNSIQPGAKFSDDTVFKLPANAEIRLLRSPDNTPFVMHGPFEGTLSSYIASCSGIMASMRAYCRESESGPPIGATRGVRRPPSTPQ